eukprot:scaffold4569_cov117-Isochrysis_galbana.AAC.2
MAPRQLILPPMEDDLHPEPGSKRVRPSSDEKSSMQVQLRACASACGTPWPGPVRTGWHCWPFPGPMARACRSWQGKSVLQRLF